MGLTGRGFDWSDQVIKSLISAVKMKLPLLVKNYRVPHLNMISLVLDNPVTNSIIVLYPLIMHTVHNVDVGYGFTNTRGLTSHYISIKRTQEISNLSLRMPILCLHCTSHPVNFKGSCFKEIFTIIFVSKLRLLLQQLSKASLLLS